jgi:hypothetical protein
MTPFSLTALKKVTRPMDKTSDSISERHRVKLCRMLIYMLFPGVPAVLAIRGAVSGGLFHPKQRIGKGHEPTAK